MPRNCDPIDADLYDELEEGKVPVYPRSVQTQRICGPFPGIPPAAGKKQCVCTVRGECFWTYGMGLIGYSMGLALDSPKPMKVSEETCV